MYAPSQFAGMYMYPPILLIVISIVQVVRLLLVLYKLSQFTDICTYLPILLTFVYSGVSLIEIAS